MSQEEIKKLVDAYEKTNDQYKHSYFNKLSAEGKKNLFLELKDSKKQQALIQSLSAEEIINFLQTSEKQIKNDAVRLLSKGQLFILNFRYKNVYGEEKIQLGKLLQEIQGILKNGQDVTREEINNDIKNLNESHDNIEKSKSAIKESRKGIIDKRFEKVKTQVSVKLLSVKQKINRLILLRTSDILENTEVLGKSKVGVFKKSIIKKYSEKLKKYEDDAKKIDDSYEKVDRLGEEIKGLEDKIKREKANIESEKLRAESLTEKLSREIPKYVIHTLSDDRKKELREKLPDPKIEDKVGNKPRKTHSEPEKVTPTPEPPRIEESPEERIMPPVQGDPQVEERITPPVQEEPQIEERITPPVQPTPTQDTSKKRVNPPVKPPVQQDTPPSQSVNKNDVVAITNIYDLFSKLSTMGVKVQVGTLEFSDNNNKYMIDGLQVNPALATGKVGKISMKGMVICQACSEQMNKNSQNMVMEQPVQDAQLDNGHSRGMGGFVNIAVILAFILLMLSIIIFVID